MGAGWDGSPKIAIEFGGIVPPHSEDRHGTVTGFKSLLLASDACNTALGKYCLHHLVPAASHHPKRVWSYLQTRAPVRQELQILYSMLQDPEKILKTSIIKI